MHVHEKELGLIAWSTVMRQSQREIPRCLSATSLLPYYRALCSRQTQWQLSTLEAEKLQGSSDLDQLQNTRAAVHNVESETQAPVHLEQQEQVLQLVE